MNRPLFPLLALALGASAVLAAGPLGPDGTSLAPAPVASPATPGTPDILGAVGADWVVAIDGTWWRKPLAGGGDWVSTGAPAPRVRHAAAAAHGDAWVVAGGLGPDGAASDRVLLLAAKGTALESTDLPSLPKPRSHAAAAVLGTRLLVVGGREADGAPSVRLEALDLADTASGWRHAPSLPAGAVVLPGATVSFNELVVLGGERAGAPSAETWAFRFQPVDGTTETGWRRRADLPLPAVAPAAVASGTAHVLALGGSSSDRAGVLGLVTDVWYTTPAVAASPASVAVRRGETIHLLDASGRGESTLAVRSVKAELHALDLIAIGAYFVLMLVVGLALSGKKETSEQFALGNRDVKWWAAGISMFATGASSISFMAIPALAFATNLVWFFPGFMMIAGYFINAHIIFPLLRRLTITSTYEYLDRRFNRGLRLLASLQCVIFQSVGRMSVIMVLPSLAISAVTGIDVTTAVLLMGVLTTIYTAIGGFNAVIWTDVFQGVLMIVAPVLVILYAGAGSDGGISGAWAMAAEGGKLHLANTTWDMALPVVWIMIIGQLFTIASNVGDQPVIQRVFSVPMREVRRTALMSTFCGITISILTYGMGVFLYGYFRSNPASLPPSTLNDQVVPLFVVNHLPAGISGLVIASIFAAAMSTLSSSMNSVATLISEDFFRPLFPKANDRSRLLVMKVSSYAVGIVGTGVAVAMAKLEITSMFATWNKIVALLGGGFVGIYVLGVFTTRANGIGAIVGGVVSIIVTTWVDHTKAVHWTAYAPIAIASCIAVGYVVSLLTGGSRKDLAGLTAFTARPHPEESAPAAPRC